MRCDSCVAPFRLVFGASPPSALHLGSLLPSLDQLGDNRAFVCVCSRNVEC
jgi:hypothetical protein